jgi:hypothetical protein
MSNEKRESFVLSANVVVPMDAWKKIVAPLNLSPIDDDALFNLIMDWMDNEGAEHLWLLRDKDPELRQAFEVISNRLMGIIEAGASEYQQRKNP